MIKKYNYTNQLVKSGKKILKKNCRQEFLRNFYIRFKCTREFI